MSCAVGEEIRPMGMRFRGFATAVIASAAVGAVFSLAAIRSSGQAPAGQAPAAGQGAGRGAGRGAGQAAGRGAASGRVPRNAWDNHPNLNGVWQALNNANWDLQDHGASPGPFYQLGAIGAVPPGQT